MYPLPTVELDTVQEYSNCIERYTLLNIVDFCALQLEYHLENHDQSQRSLLQISYLVYKQQIRVSSLQNEFIQFVYPLLHHLLRLMKDLDDSKLLENLSELWVHFWDEFKTNTLQHHTIIIIISRLLKIDLEQYSHCQEYLDFTSALNSMSLALGIELLSSFGYLNSDQVTASFYDERLFHTAGTIIGISDRFNIWNTKIQGNNNFK